jgi:hypothetical protein
MGKLVEVYLGVVDLNKVVRDPARCVDVKPIQIGIPIMVGLRIARISAAGNRVALYHLDSIEHELWVGGQEIKTADDLLVRACNGRSDSLLWVTSQVISHRPGKIVLTQLAPAH